MTKSLVSQAIALFSILLFTDVFGDVIFNQTDYLPWEFNLFDSHEGVITINAPQGVQLFEASAVADINNDGYDDILIRGAKNYVSEDDYTPVIYILYGKARLPPTINLGDSSLQTASITWQSNIEKITVQSLTTGDIDGDGKKDIVLAGRSLLNSADSLPAAKYNYRLYVVPNSYLARTTTISESSPQITRIYASTGEDRNSRIEQGIMLQAEGSFKAADINTDGTDDLVFLYPWKQFPANRPDGNAVAGQTYIVYGNNNLPKEINSENTSAPVTRIKADTSYTLPWAGMATGDVDGDNRLDLVFPGGGPVLKLDIPYGWDTSNDHTVSYVIYNSLLSTPRYRDTPLDLHNQISGITKLIRKAHRDNTLRGDDINHNVGVKDVNGDGY